MALTKVKCTASHAVDLDTGQILGPGEWAKADLDHPHNGDLVANGHLVAVGHEVTPPKSPKASKEAD